MWRRASSTKCEASPAWSMMSPQNRRGRLNGNKIVEYTSDGDHFLWRCCGGNYRSVLASHVPEHLSRFFQALEMYELRVLGHALDIVGVTKQPTLAQIKVHLVGGRAIAWMKRKSVFVFPSRPTFVCRTSRRLVCDSRKYPVMFYRPGAGARASFFMEATP